MAAEKMTVDEKLDRIIEQNEEIERTLRRYKARIERFYSAVLSVSPDVQLPKIEDDEEGPSAKKR